MLHEQEPTFNPQRPYEVYNFTETERLFWRVNDERFREILQDEQTLIHEIHPSTNSFGEFLFITTSRPGEEKRILMTFYGLGYHEYRERWFTKEWYWFQANPRSDLLTKQIPWEEAEKQINERLAHISPDLRPDTQTERGRLFELLAEVSDEDGALAELEDFKLLTNYVLAELHSQEEDEEEMTPPTGDNLLDDESRQKLPPLYNGEEKGLDALVQVKFFTPDAQWTWYASEFDGQDIFFGLVVGMEIELGYFSLAELKSVKGPLKLPIERDLHFEPKTLKELQEWHEKNR